MAKIISSASLISGSGRVLSDRSKIADKPEVGLDVTAPNQPVDPISDELDVNSLHLLVKNLQGELKAVEQRASLAEEELVRLRATLVEERQNAQEVAAKEAMAEARRQVEAEFNEQISALAELAKSLSEERQRLIEMAEDTAVEIGYSATVKILGESRVDEALVAGIVKHALRQVAKKESLVVRVSPRDYQRIVRVIRIEEQTGYWAGIQLKADESIQIGGCILDTSAGTLDARLDIQMQTLRDLLLDVRAQRR